MDKIVEEQLRQTDDAENVKLCLRSGEKSRLPMPSWHINGTCVSLPAHAGKKLQAHGARPQRVLWASTSTKTPGLRDVLYVEELIGRDTINTMPPKTIDAFRDHGRVRQSLEEDVEGAVHIMRTLDRL